MKTPPILRPWENTLAALNSSLYSPDLLKRFRFSAGDADVAMNLLSMEAQTYRRLAIQSLASICTNLASADILLWRGDLMDAALADARLFDGTEMSEEILPPRPEFYLLDPQSPPSREWTQMSTQATEQFKVKGGLSLRGVLVSPFTEDVAQKIMPESLQRSGAQTALLGHIQAKQSQQSQKGQEAARPALMVTLVFRAKNESSDSKTMPYLIDATQFADVPIHGEFAMMAIACRDFVEQPFVGRGDSPFPKWRRPDLPGSPASKRPSESNVKVIVLRRLARQKGDAGDGVQEPEGKRDYDIQWIVSGHRRRLSQPRKSDGKQVVYIAPYLKGNPDAPLTPRLNLAHVRR